MSTYKGKKKKDRNEVWQRFDSLFSKGIEFQV